MQIRKLITQLEMSPGDEVVTAVQFKDMIVVVTKRGAIFTLTGEQHDFS